MAPRVALALLALVTVTVAKPSPKARDDAPVPQFSADRYPTGVDGCAWLNWIADRTNEDDLDVVKAGVNSRINSMNTSEWESIGNSIITGSLISTINAYITDMDCERDATMVARCQGLSDVGCKFKDFASDDSTVIFNKTDGAVASPPNHKVVYETDDIRVIDVYCPPSSLELAFHTHTRLSFWISWGTSRGERYWGYNGTALFDDDLWDGVTGNDLKVMWNGPEWFHMIEEKEPNNLAPGNCDSDLAPDCPNGFKYRVELKLDDAAEHHGYSWVRYGSPRG